MPYRLFLVVLVAFSAGAGTIQYSLPPHSMVNDVVFSEDGRAFIASSRSLITLDRGGRARVVADVSLLNLVVTNDGAVWGREHSRLARIEPATDQIAWFDVQGVIQNFGAGTDGALWLITARDSMRSLVRVDPNGHVLSSALLADPEWFGPRLVAAGGAMWGVRGRELVRLSAAGVTEAFLLPLPNAFWFLSGGDFLWVANIQWNPGDAESQILRVGPAGEVLDRYPVPVRYIIGATADRAGNLWLNDEFSGRIVRMTPSGETTTITAAAWDYALDVQPMAVAPDGRIAIGKSDPGFWPTPARGIVFLVDPAQPHEIPVLSPATLLILALAIAAAGALASAGTP